MSARKLRFGATHSYARLSERKILHEMNSKSNFCEFNAKFTNKVIPHPVKVKNVMSQVQIDLVSLKSQTVEWEGKMHKKWSFPLRISSVNLTKFTEEILNGKLHFLCSGKTYWYILSLMDIFSRFHWLAPLQRKLSS